MRGNRGGGGGGSAGVDGKSGSTNGGGMGSIPATSKKMVQSLKEIVNCPELEIYAMLKECNMDPNETVNRLLSQDPFHEVKKKREKKKENKDATDSRFRGSNSNSGRVGRSGGDRHSRAVALTPQIAISDTGTSRSSRSSYKKDNGVAYSSVAHGAMEIIADWKPPILSETPFDSKLPTVNTNVTPIHSTPSFQSAWGGAPGQVSMADIVRRGRPHGKDHMSNQVTDQHHVVSSQPSPTPHEWRTAQNNIPKVSETAPDFRTEGNHCAPPNDGWNVDEQAPASNIPSISETVASSEPYTAPYDATFDKLNNQPQLQTYEFRYGEDGGVDNTADRRDTHDSTQDANGDELYEEISSCQAHQHGIVQHEVEEVVGDMQQLNLSKVEEEEDEVDDSPKENDSPAVKIPDHLQVQSADCSHLSFGSFGSGMADPFPGSFGSKPVQSNVEEIFASVEEPPVGHLDSSNAEYYGNEDLRDVSNEHVSHGLDANADGYDMPSPSQPETSRQEGSEVSAANEYSFPSSSANYGFDNNPALNVLSHSHASDHMENLPQQLGAMAYPSSLPNNLLASSVQPPKEAELSYSPFPINQLIPDKYSGNVSSISGSAMSMTEALKTGSLSNNQLLAQNPSGGSSGSGLPQQLAMHSYSQPSVPFAGANMMGYPFMPQNYTYMPPSAFQQAFPAGNNSYHQTLAAMLPQYKNSVSVSSLPQSAAAAALASGYGAFGSLNSVPGGNFSLNNSGGSNVAAAPQPPAASSISYDDLLRAQQYKEAAQLLALQQQVQGGPGSRTMTAVPANSYYGFPGQTQHQQQQPPAGSAAGGYRQVQQAPPPPQMHSQHYGNLGGYPSNFYAAGNLPLEQQQQQMLREGSQGVQQLQASQVKQQPQHQQIWQNNY